MCRIWHFNIYYCDEAKEYLKKLEEKEMIEHLTEKIANLKRKLNDALEVLENCGYCRECLWDKESISDIVESTTKAKWPIECMPLCEECNEKFVESVENKLQEELKCDGCKEEPCVCTQILPTYEEMIDALVEKDIQSIIWSLQLDDTDFLNAVLRGDGWIPYNQLTDLQLHEEYKEQEMNK